MKSFRDPYGNMLPNSWDTQSENPTTFNAAYFFSLVVNTPNQAGNFQFTTFKLVTNKFIRNNESWRTMEYDENPSWSIDEKISALALLNKWNPSWIDKIPVFPSFNNSSWVSWYRPDVMAYTLIIKYPWTKLFLYWIVALKIEQSIYDFNRDAKGQSSGMQLAFIMLMGLRHIESVERLKSDIRLAMDIYYPEEDHPTRLLWGKETQGE
jgi:hypothetical protein